MASSPKDFRRTDVNSTANAATERMLASVDSDQALLKQPIINSPDCLKILDPDSKLLSLNAAGQALLEIDDVTPWLNSGWTDWWKGPANDKALPALAEAKAGRTARFEAFATTAKGTPK